MVTNRNSVPLDPNGAWYSSGVRMGTPALTTLGMSAHEMDEVADIIVTILRATSPTSTASGEPSKAKYALDEHVVDDSRARCADLLGKFPLYPTIQL